MIEKEGYMTEILSGSGSPGAQYWERGVHANFWAKNANLELLIVQCECLHYRKRFWSLDKINYNYHSSNKTYYKHTFLLDLYLDKFLKKTIINCSYQTLHKSKLVTKN